ncbi:MULTISPECIES: hypothetical protein [Vibrio]|nr:MULTISPECIES: hypothetical protein [Vibrio]
MKDPDSECSKWKLERKKGAPEFVIRAAFSAIFGVMIGRSIAPLSILETA